MSMSLKFNFNGLTKRVGLPSSAGDQSITWQQVHDMVVNLFPALSDKKFVLSWYDEEGDRLMVSSDDELREAIRVMTAMNSSLIKFEVHYIASRPVQSAGQKKTNNAVNQTSTQQQKEDKEQQKEDKGQQDSTQPVVPEQPTDASTVEGSGTKSKPAAIYIRWPRYRRYDMDPFDSLLSRFLHTRPTCFDDAVDLSRLLMPDLWREVVDFPSIFESAASLADRPQKEQSVNSTANQQNSALEAILKDMQQCLGEYRRKLSSPEAPTPKTEIKQASSASNNATNAPETNHDEIEDKAAPEVKQAGKEYILPIRREVKAEQ